MVSAMKSVLRTSIAISLGVAVGICFATMSAAGTPERGGILNIIVGSKIPSYDGHQEGTFGMIHPIRPFYSLLIRINPENPQSPGDFVCDVCEGKVPKPTDDGLTYTFTIRGGIKFHDGTPLTSADVKATHDKIIFPPEGVPSLRKGQYKMVASVTAPDATTLVFRLKYPSGAFIPSLASPFNFIYSKKDLDTHGYAWHRKNINGTGAFKFVEHQPGAFVSGVKYENYHHEGRPYLDGFKAILAPKMSARVQAIEGNRAAIEFRGFPPKQRDDLVNALGDKITVQEGDWNCALVLVFNHKQPPFDDARVRKALTLAIDRWGGSEYLSKIAIVKTVGGIVFPKHPLAANKDELERLAGYWPDINKSREEARRLLKEVGQENLEFTLLNRATDQPYRVMGTWLIDQWNEIGIKVKQNAIPTSEWLASLRKTKDFGVAIGANCQSVVNPLVDVSAWLGSAVDNYAQYEDPVLEDLFDKMNKEGDPKKQREYMRKFEHRAVNEMAHLAVTLWWYKINPHRSYVKGWKIAPSHYLNQHLDQVWLDK
jgi:peptide/nickel transport system substrate-binding protein